jgi:hypothetical protein
VCDSAAHNPLTKGFSGEAAVYEGMAPTV